MASEVRTPSPGKGTGAAGGLGPPPKECDPGRQGCRPPPLSRRTGLRLAGGVASELPALWLMSPPGGLDSSTYGSAGLATRRRRDAERLYQSTISYTALCVR